MTNSSKFRATFHVSHPVIGASEIVETFKLPTRYCYSVGDQKKTKQGVPLKGVYERTHVSFTLHESPLSFSEYSLAEFIVNILESFENKHLHKINYSGGECYFLIGVFSPNNVMFDFGASAIECLANVKVGLKFDFYGGE